MSAEEARSGETGTTDCGESRFAERVYDKPPTEDHGAEETAAIEALVELLKGLSISPNDLSLYKKSFTHSSYLNENGLPAWEGNERLEFLGDAVLGLAVTELLYQIHPHKDEGTLSKIKSVVVSRETLAKQSRQLGLGKLLQMGVGEQKSGGNKRLSILAAVFESLLGAIYLDLGYDAARHFCHQRLRTVIDSLGTAEKTQDYKSRLQELVQRRTGQIPRYRLLRSEGPDHERWFCVEVCLRGTRMGIGEGPSKKVAEQNAAGDALNALENSGRDWDEEFESNLA